MKENLKQTAKLQKDLQFVLQWMQSSIDFNKGQGSSAFYSRLRHPLTGWSPAFPETTGYLIPTLFDCADYFNDKTWHNYALGCADWLCQVQRPSGGFPSAYADNPNLSIFNTAQIILGTLRSFQETTNPKYEIVTQKAYSWLLEGLDDGIWENHNYVKNYLPTYYTRVIFPMLKTAKALNYKGEQRLLNVLSHFSDKINDNYSVEAWEFHPGQPAFTHTIAYTIRGFLECGIIVGNEALINQAAQITTTVLQQKLQNGKTAGSYNQNWEGDYSYSCLTGLFQLALICFKLAQLNEKEHWLQAGLSFLEEGNQFIPHRHLLASPYAVPGSYPLNGKYMSYKYPTWAGKFYIDAVLQFNRLQN